MSQRKKARDTVNNNAADKTVAKKTAYYLIFVDESARLVTKEFDYLDDLMLYIKDKKLRGYEYAIINGEIILNRATGLSEILGDEDLDESTEENMREEDVLDFIAGKK